MERLGGMEKFRDRKARWLRLRNCHAQHEAWREDGDRGMADLWLGRAEGCRAMLSWLGWEE